MMNTTLKSYLIAFDQDSEDNCIEIFTMVELTFNNVVNVSMADTPFYLSYGRNLIALNM